MNGSIIIGKIIKLREDFYQKIHLIPNYLWIDGVRLAALISYAMSTIKVIDTIVIKEDCFRNTRLMGLTIKEVVEEDFIKVGYCIDE